MELRFVVRIADSFRAEPVGEVDCRIVRDDLDPVLTKVKR